MSKVMLVLGLGMTLVVARPLRAEDHPEMQQAQTNLEAARSSLQSAAHDYGGHRKRALELVNQALAQVRDGLATVNRQEQKVEHKEARVEKKADALKAKEQKMKAN